jgi:hypothetical protein
VCRRYTATRLGIEKIDPVIGGIEIEANPGDVVDRDVQTEAASLFQMPDQASFAKGEPKLRSAFGQSQ